MGGRQQQLTVAAMDTEAAGERGNAPTVSGRELDMAISAGREALCAMVQETPHSETADWHEVAPAISSCENSHPVEQNTNKFHALTIIIWLSCPLARNVLAWDSFIVQTSK